MAKAADPLHVVEAAYEHIDAPVAAWLSAILDAAGALDHGFGRYALSFDGYDASCRIDVVACASAPPEIVAGLQSTIASTAVETRRAVTAFGATFFEDRVDDGDVAKHDAGGAFVAAGVLGAFGVVGSDAQHRGVCVFAPLARRRFAPTHPSSTWRRVAVHLSAAARLRRRRAAAHGDPDAVMTPAGVLLHANDDATAAMRGALGDRARAIDSARTRRVRADPRAALDLWKALVASRWSLVDTYESDGKRLLVAHRNESPQLDVRKTLTPREREVAALVAGARSNKEIAYELGIGASSVETLVARLRAKLGAPTRAALAAALAGAALSGD